MRFNFTLSDELQEIDTLGKGYIYKAEEHPTAKDVMVVQYEQYGEMGVTNYTKEEVRQKLMAGHWIKM